MNTSKKHLVSLVLGALALAAAACNDPVPAPCQSAHGEFAVQYTLVSKTGSSKCADLEQVGDLVGVMSFNARGAAGELPRYDLAGSVAIQTAGAGATLSQYVDERGLELASGDAAFALGPFAGAQPSGGLCSVPTFRAAHMRFAAVPATPDDPATTGKDESDPGLPAFEGTWSWSNVTFVSTADAPGTAFAGTVNTTTPDEDGNACSFVYKAVGLFPAVACGTDDETKPIADAKGHAPTDASWEPTFEQKADPAQCAAEADPKNGRPLGSGINPNFRTVCAEFVKGVDYHCVLESAFAKTLLGQ